MSAGVSVAASGAALAFLLYENVSSENNQAGYLIGDVVSEIKNLISDSDFGEEKTETVIHIHNFVEVKPLYTRYSLADCKQVKSDASGKMNKSVVGWYSFRRNVTAVPTLRDRCLHGQLLKLFERDPEQFLFCLLTSSENSENRTYSFKQHFLLFNPVTRKYDAVPLLIENLANISQHYREKLSPSSERMMQGLVEKSWGSQDGSNLVSKLETKLHTEINKAVRKLLSCEEQLEQKKQTLERLQKERDDLIRCRNNLALKKDQIGDAEDKESATGRRRTEDADERGNNTQKSSSDDVICISDDESSSATSPVLGTTNNKRSNWNRLQ